MRQIFTGMGRRLRAAAKIGLAAGLSVLCSALVPVAAETPPATKVGYIEVSASEVPVEITLTGRAVSPNATQLRPRVGGAITAIYYTPGVVVQADDPLFAIDPLAWAAAFASAEADLERANADLLVAQTAQERAERLRASSATPEVTLELAISVLNKAKASQAEAEAAYNLAKAQLDWTTLRAPISGVIGMPQIAIGDLVTANQAAALAEIVQTNPLYIDLNEPYPLRLRINARAEKGEIRLTEPILELILDDGTRISGAARLQASGAQVSATTGTRQLRFEINNDAGRIAPGMFVRGALTLGQQTAILVPQRATQRERDGRLFAWVAEENTARKRHLTEAGSWGNAWIIQAGLTPGDKVLLDGTNNLRDGTALELIAAEIDEAGVVRDANPPASSVAPTQGNN